MPLSLDQRISKKWFVLFFILGCVVSYGAGFLSARRSAIEKGIHTQMEDEDGDGRIDYMLVSSNGVPQSLALDRNRDGQYDYREYYINNKAARSEADNDFDGRFEEWTTFYLGLPSAVETDADGDGVVDILTSFTNGIVSYSIIRMTHGKDDYFTEYFTHGIRSKVVIFRDGKERVLHCGKCGQIEIRDE